MATISSGYAFLGGFYYIFKQLANKLASFIPAVNNCLFRFIHTVHRGAGKTGRILPPFFTLIILWNPVVVVQAMSLLFSFDWMNVIALVVSIVGGFFIGVILVYVHDSQMWERIFREYFLPSQDCRFELITTGIEHDLKTTDQDLGTTRDVLRNAFRLSPAEVLFRSRSLRSSILAFFVHPAGPIPPLGPVTYSMAGGTSYVFLQQSPEDKELNARFFRMHEIGHTTVMNWVIRAQGWFAVVYFCLLFVFVAFHRDAGILALFVALALAALWAYFWQQQGKSDERREFMADAFALVHMDGRPDFHTTIARTARRHAQILNRTGMESSLIEGLEQNMLGQMVLSIPLWLGLLILAGMLWLGATLSIKEWEELLALSVVWVVVPAVWHYYHIVLSPNLPRTAQARREALAFLKAHAACFKITEQSVEGLRLEDVPPNVLENLKSMKNQNVMYEKEFLDKLKVTIGEEQTIRYQSLILQYAAHMPLIISDLV